MIRSRILATLVPLAAFLLLSSAVQAEIVQVQFQGTTTVSGLDEFNEPSGDIFLVIDGAFSIDTSAPSGPVNNFQGAASGLELTIFVAGTSGDIGVTDLSVFPYFTSGLFNAELAAGDVFVGEAPEEIGIDFPVFSFPGLSNENFSLILQGATGLVTANDLASAAALLGMPGILEMFGTTEASFQSTSLFEEPFSDGLVFQLEFIDSSAVVPVPAAAWLFGSALGLLGWVRRRTA